MQSCYSRNFYFLILSQTNLRINRIQSQQGVMCRIAVNSGTAIPISTPQYTRECNIRSYYLGCSAMSRCEINNSIWLIHTRVFVEYTTIWTSIDRLNHELYRYSGPLLAPSHCEILDYLTHTWGISNTIQRDLGFETQHVLQYSTLIEKDYLIYQGIRQRI